MYMLFCDFQYKYKKIMYTNTYFDPTLADVNVRNVNMFKPAKLNLVIIFENQKWPFYMLMSKWKQFLMM